MMGNTFRLRRAGHLLLLLLLLGLAGQVTAQGDGERPLPPVLLKARTIQADRGFEPAVDSLLQNRVAGEPVYLLVQLEADADRAALAAQGIDLQTYIPHDTWVARIDPAQQRSAAGLALLKEIAWVGTLQPTDKQSPSLAAQAAEALRARAPIVLHVQFHPDVTPADRRAVLMRHGGFVLQEVGAIDLVTVRIDPAAIDAVSRESRVLWLEPALPNFTPTNAENRARTNVDNIQNVAPYNLSGNGITILVFDGGRARHPDYDGRRIHEDSSAISDHASHVAGTVLGNGAGNGDSVLANRGMAPQADLITYGLETDGTNLFLYDNLGDVQQDWQNALDRGADIGTASLGTNLAPNGTARINAGQPVGVFNCNREGDYPAASQLLDNIVTGSLGRPIIMTWAQGNERGDGRCGFNFNTTAPPATAKNHITVGATNENADTPANFTGFGPTDDGRLKPVISAPGVNVLSTIPDLLIDNRNRNCVNNPSDPEDGDDFCYPYDTMGGTSMATPTVAGIIALMLEQFRSSYSTDNNLLNATVKAILMDTAVDGDGVAGPDFRTGYGRVDAQAAVDLIRDNRFREGTIADPAQIDEYFIEVQPGDATLSVSLAWDDPAGALLAAQELVNNLDLRLVDPSNNVWRPWVLDPANPGNNPARGFDTLNNQERVTIANPQAGWWRVEVRVGTLPQGPQSYGLASSHNPWTFSIVYPTADQPANAGYFLSPGKIQIHLDISDGYRPSTNITTLDPATDLELAIGSEVIGAGSGAIINAGSVGNQYHLVVRAPAQSGAGTYDLTAKFAGGLDVEQRDAVIYEATPADPRALSVVLDRSGSMSQDGRLPAAKNAARNFIFLAEIGDGIAQTIFSDLSQVVQPLSDVNSEGDLAAMADVMTPVTADGWTSIGDGMRDGYDLIDDDGRIPTMVLLSDGYENTDPLWADVRGGIPTSVRIDTVALGPIADQALMAQIANRHNGTTYFVPTGAGSRAPLADVSVATTVANRTADVYSFISNANRNYQRHAEWASTLGNGNMHTRNFTLNESVPYLFFSVNWADPGTTFDITLRRPGGAVVNPADGDTSYREDKYTSKRYRMTAPAAGLWQIEIKHTGGPASEYLATVEGPVDTQVMLVTPSIDECRPTRPVQLCATVTDNKGILTEKGGSLVVRLGDGEQRSFEEVRPGYFCAQISQSIPEGTHAAKLTYNGVDRDGNTIRRIVRQDFYCGDFDTADVLLVNDVNVRDKESYPQRDYYSANLDALGVAHHIWDTQVDGPPSVGVLLPYKIVIWLTADNVYDPDLQRGTLDPDEEIAVAKWLEARRGNIFALSSQGYLNAYGVTDFGSKVLGVAANGGDSNSTTLRGIRNTPLGHLYGPEPLSNNSSNILVPTDEAQVNFVEQGEKAIGLTNEYGRGCTTFFSFPLEALGASDLQNMLNRIVNWQCAPRHVYVNTSATQTDVIVGAGSQISETFTIANTNGNGGPMQVGINNGPTHLWLLSDSSAPPSLLLPYHVGDLPAATAAAASTPFDPLYALSSFCDIDAGGTAACCIDGACDAEALLHYDVAIVWNPIGTPFAEADKLGDMLAAFVDQGGTVLLGGQALDADDGIGGRFLAERYSPLLGRIDVGLAKLDAILTPGHPVVEALGAYQTAHSIDVEKVGSGDVQVHALLNNGYPAVATHIVQPGTAGQVIAINASFENGDLSGDIGTLVANALGLLDASWRNPGWFSVHCAVTPPAETNLQIIFDGDTRCPNVEGDVEWTVGLVFDGSFTPARSMTTATYVGKIVVDHDDMATGRVVVPLSMALSSVPTVVALQSGAVATTPLVLTLALLALVALLLALTARAVRRR